MNLDARVTAHDEASPVIAKIQASVEKLQSAIRKMAGNPTKGMNDDLARTNTLAEKVGATLTRTESAAMRDLNRRFAFERRMNRQKTSEEAESARQSKLFDNEALTRLRERMAFQGRMARQQQDEARETARIQAEAARSSARAARDAAREQGQAIKSQINQFRELEKERARAMKAAGASVGRMGGAVRRGAVAGAAGAAIVGAGARREFDKLTQSGVSIDDALTQAQIHIFGTMPAGEARKAAEGLRKRLMKVAVGLGSKTSDLIGAYVEASQAGVESDILDKVVGDGARYAKMNKLNLPNTLEETGYALQGLKSFGQVTDKVVGQYFNHMSYLVATTAANREQMSSFGKRGLAAGASVGMSLDDTLAFGAAATAAGAQGSQASRMLSTQTGRMAGWQMKGRNIARKGNKTEEDRLFLQAPQLLGYGNYENLANQFRHNFFNTYATLQERLKKLNDPLKRRSLEKILYGQEFGSINDAMIMGSNLRDYRQKLNSSEANTFLDRNWSKETGNFGFIIDQIRGVFQNLSDGLGLELKPLWSDLRDWAVQTPAAFEGFQETFRMSLRGFLGGLGSSDGTMAGLLRHWFGDPAGFRLNSAAWGDFFRGVGKGLRDVGETIQTFFRVFTGSDSPEAIGRWTSRILGFSAALVVLSPLLTVVGALTSGILAIASALKVGKSVLDLAKGKPPVAPEGPAVAKPGLLGRTLGFLGRMVPAIAMPLTTDPSKADNDRLMKRLGDLAKGQKRDERSMWQDPPARVQKQSSTEDWRNYVHPASLESNDLVRGVEKLSRGIDTLNGRIQLAALDGGGALTASRLARAAGTGTAGSVMSSVGIPYNPGAGGAALYGSRPGSKLPGAFGGGGGRSSSPADDGSSDPIPGTMNPRLAGARKSLMDELDRNPALKRDVIKTASMENRGSPQKMQAVIESMVNRSKMNGYTSLNQAIHSGFYGPVNRGGLRGALSEKDRRDGEAALAQVKAGSNMIGYRTDQGMLTDPGARRYMREADHSGHRVIGGENFFYMGQKGREWARRQEAMDAAAGTPSVSAKATETLTGKPGTFDLGGGIKGKPFHSAHDLAKETPAESLAKQAPPVPSGGGGGRSGAGISPTIHVHESRDPERTANMVQQRLADFANYSTTDLPSRV